MTPSVTHHKMDDNVPPVQRHIEDTRVQLRQMYAKDDRPWVVAFSGGKDSTVVLQLVYELLTELGKEAHKPIFVMSSDTRVEAPNVSTYLHETLSSIEAHAAAAELPLEVRLIEPTPEQSFWGKLLGHGYPSPTRWFRWCTSNMKIKPARAAIDSITERYGSAILLLGTRTDESSARSARIQAREVTARGLNPHHEIPDTLVATPIVNWTTDQIWDYLFSHNPPPWGSSHDYLLSLYRQAAGGECPVVLDLATPSCGGSRFGCWTCTVVKEDKSLQGFIQSGEEWMKPLNDFRDRLKAVRELPEWRAPHRRNGASGPGPFLPEKRQLLLQELLSLEQRIGKPLISDAEIEYIQQAWNAEFDLQDRALAIATAHGRTIAVVEQRKLMDSERRILDRLVAEHGISPDLVERLLRLVLEDYPDLRVYGSKAQLQRDIEQAIEAAVSHAAAAGDAA